MTKIFLGWKKLPFSNYVAAIAALGLAAERSEPDGCDALLLPGGGDIHPHFYGQPIDGAEAVDETRDEYELELFRRFAERGKPIFGICRGLQLVNVALGGTLRQHIEGHDQIEGVDRIHGARTDNSLLHALYGERFSVNSAHHQAIDRLGTGLRAVAWADDGTIEAVRHGSLPVFAVQWHPERFDREGSALLEALFKSAPDGENFGLTATRSRAIML